MNCKKRFCNQIFVGAIYIMALAETKKKQQNEVHHLTTTINQWWRGWHLLKVKLSDFDTRILMLSYSCYGVSIFNGSTTNWSMLSYSCSGLFKKRRWTARKGVYNQIYVGAQYYGIFEMMREQQKYISWQPQSINDNEDDTFSRLGWATSVRGRWCVRLQIE